jgi:transcriptional regulator with XRE-family HTH domain
MINLYHCNGAMIRLKWGMSMDAIAGYLQGLREGRDLSKADVASALRVMVERKVDPVTIWRIETGRQNPGADLLLAMVVVLRGTMTEVEALFLQTDATHDDGVALGRTRAQTVEEPC